MILPLTVLRRLGGVLAPTKRKVLERHEQHDLLSKPGTGKTMLDPVCGTGGMLSVSEQYLRTRNPDARRCDRAAPGRRELAEELRSAVPRHFQDTVVDRLNSAEELSYQLLDNEDLAQQVRQVYLPLVYGKAKVAWQEHCSIGELLGPPPKEGAHLEYKSTFRTRAGTGELFKSLQTASLKTVAAFLNSREGGTLLIGVADDGSVFGLEPDYATLRKDGKDDRDLFGLHLNQALINAVGHGRGGERRTGDSGGRRQRPVPGPREAFELPRRGHGGRGGQEWPAREERTLLRPLRQRYACDHGPIRTREIPTPGLGPLEYPDPARVESRKRSPKRGSSFGRDEDHLGPGGRPADKAQPLPHAPLYPQAHRGACRRSWPDARHGGRRGRERQDVPPVPVQVDDRAQERSSER